LDAAVACAGRRPVPAVPVGGLPPARWRQTLDANLTATVLTARAFCRRLRGSGGRGPSSLVLVGSTVRPVRRPTATTRRPRRPSARGCCARSRTKPSGSSPGGTGERGRAGLDGDPGAAGRLAPAGLRPATATIALRKTGLPADVAAAVVWLASGRAAGYLTGEW
jgi:NAD(P)-dependent dehydrogenase (short-subunit alcohol dehydrogenase family)